MTLLGYTEEQVLNMTPRKFFVMYEQYAELKGLKKQQTGSIDALP